ARSTGPTSASATTARSPVAASPSARRSRSASRPRESSARTSRGMAQRGPGTVRGSRPAFIFPRPNGPGACPGSADRAVLDQVVDIERAQRLGHVTFPGVDRVPEQRGDLGDVPPGLDRVPLGGFGRRDGAQQLPEELHVDMVHRPAYGEVVQLARGKRVQFVTGHPWTLSPAPAPRRPWPAPPVPAVASGRARPIY